MNLKTCTFIFSAALATAGVPSVEAQDKQPVSAVTGDPVKGPSRIEAGLDFAETLGTSTFNSNQTIREFAEDGTLTGAYKVGQSPGFGFHIQYNLGKTFGVRLGGQTFSRKSTGTFDAKIPHPFFLAKPRSAQATVSALGFNEAAVSLTGVYRGGAGKWKFNLEGGPAYFSVDATVAEKWEYGQVYPYDTVTLSGVARTKQQVSPFGFAAGIEFGRELSPAVSVVAQGRYTGGSGDLTVNGQKINIKAGGAQARIGLRIVLARSKAKT